MQSRTRFVWLVLGVLGSQIACGKPVDPSGKEDAIFVKASMGVPGADGEDPPLAASVAIDPVAALVEYNRLKTPDKLNAALNKTPGQFSKLDLDKDGAPDPLTMTVSDAPDGHVLELHVKPVSGEYMVATMMFDPEWTFLGHYNGAKGGAASTLARPLPVAPSTSPTPVPVAGPSPAPVPTSAPAPAPATTPTPAPVTAPTPVDPAAAGVPSVTGNPAAAAGVTGSVQAVPTGSDAAAGVKATP